MHRAIPTTQYDRLSDDDKLVTCYKDVSEHYRDCNGNSSAHVQGRRQLVLLLSGYIPIMIIHTRMRISGRFKGYFLSEHTVNFSARG